MINNLSECTETIDEKYFFIKDGDEGKPACAIYNDDTFCFIELKCIKPKLLANTKRKAKRQLENTINKFNNQDIIKNKKLEAYMCFNCKIDENYTKKGV
ncbi:MAG: hypothetical protein U9N02_00160 [Campylobacterota bacterium]|nr:hypothetical protein [Campylobacterota bacterium]